MKLRNRWDTGNAEKAIEEAVNRTVAKDPNLSFDLVRKPIAQAINDSIQLRTQGIAPTDATARYKNIHVTASNGNEIEVHTFEKVA